MITQQNEMESKMMSLGAIKAVENEAARKYAEQQGKVAEQLISLIKSVKVGETRAIAPGFEIVRDTDGRVYFVEDKVPTEIEL